jgi:hypothetical protein
MDPPCPTEVHPHLNKSQVKWHKPVIPATQETNVNSIQADPSINTRSSLKSSFQKMVFLCGNVACGRVPAWQVQGPEFKPPFPPKKAYVLIHNLFSVQCLLNKSTNTNILVSLGVLSIYVYGTL